jgi:hypothetical protein
MPTPRLPNADILPQAIMFVINGFVFGTFIFNHLGLSPRSDTENTVVRRVSQKDTEITTFIVVIGLRRFEVRLILRAYLKICFSDVVSQPLASLRP